VSTTCVPPPPLPHGLQLGSVHHRSPVAGRAEHFPEIRTDLTKIDQILFLLLDNAVKFAPSGRITISARVDGERLWCEVRDTGIGICPDDQQLIFDELFADK
jgi:signal transduction histidine kinase